MPNPVEGLLEVYEDMVRQGCLLSPTLFNIFLERIMTDALKDHEGTVSIGGRTITNLRFADDIDGLAGEEEELANLVERLDKASTEQGKMAKTGCKIICGVPTTFAVKRLMMMMMMMMMIMSSGDRI